MHLSSRLALVGVLALLWTACGGSSGGSSSQVSSGEGHLLGDDVRRLRRELTAAGIRPVPAPPAVSDELFDLGQALFFDKVLSGKEEISCATCHLTRFHTGDGRTLSNGVGGIGLGPDRSGGSVIRRNARPLFALHLERTLLWDGRVERVGRTLRVPRNVTLPDELRAVFTPGFEVLAAQAMLPPLSSEEMRGWGSDLALLGWDTVAVWAALNERLLDLPGYVRLLRAAYPGAAVQDLTFAHAANAIAAFEVRAFARTDSPFERFVRGDDAALTPRQLAGGLEFFGRAGCVRCHSGPLFSDQEFHNVGVPQISVLATVSPIVLCVDCRGDDYGRREVTDDAEDLFEFRTPSLLNVELTGPYGHAGQFARLRDFVAHYRDPEESMRNYDLLGNVSDPQLSSALVPNMDAVLASLDPRLRTANDFDVDAVVEFLRALTAEDASDLSDIVPASVPSGLPIF